MLHQKIQSYFGEEIHTISFSHMTETKELLMERDVEEEESSKKTIVHAGHTFERTGNSSKKLDSNSEIKSIAYPTSVDQCKDYITLYCHWQVSNFADRIRKLFEFHFIKEMHDYFDKSKFLNKVYPVLQEVIKSDEITEQDLIQNSAEILAREELEQRKKTEIVYNNMLKQMKKLGQEIAKSSKLANGKSPH